MHPDAQVTKAIEPVGDAIGQSVPRIDGPEKICGRAEYTDGQGVMGLAVDADTNG